MKGENLKLPITLKSIKNNEDGTSEIEIEFDDDMKRILMKAQDINEWDNDRANKEFLKAIESQLLEENEQ